MTRLLDRIGGFFPAAVALALPVVFLGNLSDLFILPRASIVIAGACLGTGLALLLPRRTTLGALRWPLFGAAAAALLAFAFSVSWPLSFAGSYTRYESLPMRLSYLGLLSSAVWLLRGDIALVGGARLHAFLARFGRWGVSLSAALSLTPREAAVAGLVFGTSVASLEAWAQWVLRAPFRPDGNLGNANLLAGLIAMAAPLAVDRALRGGPFAVAWGAAPVVMAFGILATTSRSGGVGAYAGVLALGVLAVRGRAVIAAAATWVAAMVALFIVVQVSPLRALNDDPISLRVNLWRDGLHMIAARPLTGWGEDTTGIAFGRFLSQDYASLVTFDRIHSGPLDIAATQGVIGLAALTGLMAVIALGAWRFRFDRDVASLLAALLGFSVWVSVNFDWAPVTGAFWVLAGVLWSRVRSLQVGGVPQPARPAQARRIILPLGLALVAIPLAVFPILADAWYVKGRPDLAGNVDPLQAQYHWAIGTLPELRKAAELGETDPSLYVQLGDAELHAGNRDQAISAYRRSLEIDPFYTPASERLKSLGAV